MLLFIYSICANGTIDCGEEEQCIEDVICPNNQVYGEVIPNCDLTCATVNSNTKCDSEIYGLYKGCVCADGLVKSPEVSHFALDTTSL